MQSIESDDERSEFEKLYYSYRNLMFYIANNILHNEYLAEDAVSETFLKLANNFDTVLKFGDINCNRTKSYVAISTKNTCLDLLKKEKHYLQLEDSSLRMVPDKDFDELERLIEAESYENVINEFMNLPDEMRHVLQLYAIYEHDLDTIAKELGISREGVKKKIYRARKLLRERLKNKDE